MAMALSATALPGQRGTQPKFQIASASFCKPLSPSSVNLAPAGNPSAGFARRGSRGRGAVAMCYARPVRTVEERFRIQVERNVDEARLQELGVRRWAKWESDVCGYEHEWKVNEQVYVVKGSVRVTPEDCDDCAYFYAGDLVRFPKWFSATLNFDGEYEQRYRFLAYGDE